MVRRFLKSSPGKGLLFTKENDLDITTYSYAGYAGDKKSTTNFCTYVGQNLVLWRNKKQIVVESSSAELQYKTMAQSAAEMSWIKEVLEAFGVQVCIFMLMKCDNRAATYIANNHVF